MRPLMGNSNSNTSKTNSVSQDVVRAKKYTGTSSLMAVFLMVGAITGFSAIGSAASHEAPIDDTNDQSVLGEHDSNTSVDATSKAAQEQATDGLVESAANDDATAESAAEATPGTASQGSSSNNVQSVIDITVRSESSSNGESSDSGTTESITLNGEEVDLSRTGRYKEKNETDNYESEIKLDIDIDTDSEARFNITTN